MRQFAGGASNLTFELRWPTRTLILRRPPRGSKAKSAHDMRREFTIQSRLAPMFAYVAPMLAFCDDESVIGSEFYVMERVDGTILRADLPDGLTLDAGQARDLCGRFLDVLVELGVTEIGENRHPEAGRKLDDLAGPKPRLHFIGGLQTNKANAVARALLGNHDAYDAGVPVPADGRRSGRWFDSGLGSRFSGWFAGWFGGRGAGEEPAKKRRRVSPLLLLLLLLAIVAAVLYFGPQYIPGFFRGDDLQPGVRDVLINGQTTSDAIVYFRGVRHFLPGPFPSVMDAMSAGEALCLQLGWRGKGPAVHHSVHRERKRLHPHDDGRHQRLGKALAQPREQRRDHDCGHRQWARPRERHEPRRPRDRDRNPAQRRKAAGAPIINGPAKAGPYAG